MKVDISKLTGITISPVNKEEDGKSDPGSFQGLDLSVTKVERPLRSGRSPRSSHPTSPIKSSPREAAISPRRASPREPAISPRRASPREPAISPRRVTSREHAISPRRSTAISPRRFNPKDPAISPRRSSPRACFSPKSAHNTSISSFDSRESLNQSTDSLNAFSFEADELRKDMAYEEAIESAIARGMRESNDLDNETDDIVEKLNIIEHESGNDHNSEAMDKLLKLEENTNISSAPSQTLSPPKSPPKISPPTSPRVNKYDCIRKSLKKIKAIPALKPLKPGLEIISQDEKTPDLQQETDKLQNMNTNLKEQGNTSSTVKEIKEEEHGNTNEKEIIKQENINTTEKTMNKEEDVNTTKSKSPMHITENNSEKIPGKQEDIKVDDTKVANKKGKPLTPPQKIKRKRISTRVSLEQSSIQDTPSVLALQAARQSEETASMENEVSKSTTGVDHTLDEKILTEIKVVPEESIVTNGSDSDDEDVELPDTLKILTGEIVANAEESVQERGTRSSVHVNTMGLSSSTLDMELHALRNLVYADMFKKDESTASVNQISEDSRELEDTKHEDFVKQEQNDDHHENTRYEEPYEQDLIKMEEEAVERILSESKEGAQKSKMLTRQSRFIDIGSRYVP